MRSQSLMVEIIEWSIHRHTHKIYSSCYIRTVELFFKKKSDCVNSSSLYLLEEEWKKNASQKQEEEELTTSQREMIDYIWFLGDGYLDRKGSFYIWYI